MQRSRILVIAVLAFVVIAVTLIIASSTHQTPSSIEIAVTGNCQRTPFVVTVPVTLPIDSREEALQVAEAACPGFAQEANGDPDVTENQTAWRITHVIPGLGYSPYEIIIQKATGAVDADHEKL